jgi:hypothetical protein
MTTSCRHTFRMCVRSTDLHRSFEQRQNRSERGIGPCVHEDQWLICFDLLPDFLDPRKAASSARSPARMFGTPPGKSLVAIISKKISAGSGLVLDASTTAVFPLRITGAINETRARSAGSSDDFLAAAWFVGSNSVCNSSRRISSISAARYKICQRR